MKRNFGILIVSLCLLGVIAGGAPSAVAGGVPSPYSFVLSSPAFGFGGTIPTIYTCMGKDISPPLKWKGAPVNTKSYALVMDDPDAPDGDFIHWVIFNIPVKSTGLPKNITIKSLPTGAIEGINDFRELGYSGPCPPAGKAHRFFFTLYAVNTVLILPVGVTKTELMNALSGHVIAKTRLMGKFGRH